MSISGLSNHLCVAVATISSLIFVSLTRAANDSYDFTDSRQYKRNLAVSKFREDPQWMSNYTWKPPEKFYGPRNRPPWEIDGKQETESQRKEREEYEKWEKEMREVTRRQREKWKTYEDSEGSSSKQIPMASNDDLGETDTAKLKKSRKPSGFEKRLHGSEKANEEVQESFDSLPKEWKNGRWGMSNIKLNVPDVFEETGKSLQKPNSMSQIKDGTAVRETLSNGRWGMSAQGGPTSFLKGTPEKSSETSLMHGSTPSNEKSSLSGQLELLALRSNRWGMNVKEVPKGFLEDAKRNKKSNNAQKRNLHEKSAISGNSEAIKKFPNSFFNDRWGMKAEKTSSKEASKIVIKSIDDSTKAEEFSKMSRRFLPPGNSGIKIHSAQENSGKINPNGHKMKSFHIDVDKIEKNNLDPQKLSFSKLSKTPNDIIINLFLNFMKTTGDSDLYKNLGTDGNLPILNVQITVHK